jgi:hypothetical protein
MVSHGGRSLAIVLGLACAFASITFASIAAPASAQSSASAAGTADEAATLEARALFEEGVRLSRAERWLEALDAFRGSRERVERPRTLFNMAIALDRLGRLRESMAAIDRYLEISDATADDADRREAARMRLACERRLVTLTLRVTPPDATVEIDGEDAPGGGAERRITWDPGDHVVVVRAAGHAPLRESLSLPPGSLVERTIVLSADTTTTVVPVDEGVEHHAPDERGQGGSSEPVDTRERSIVEDPIFWVIVGSVAVAAGVGIGVGVFVATEPQPYGGSTGLRF